MILIPLRCTTAIHVKTLVRTGLSLALAALLLPAPAAGAAVLYAAPAAAGVGDCSAWSDPCTLQTALSLAASGDEVWVQRGLYKPTETTDRAISFELVEDVAVYGGFVGTETQVGDRDWQANPTVLSGDIGNNDVVDPNGIVTSVADINGANSYHVVRVGAGITAAARLDGFVVTAGSAEAPEANGGGIHIEGGDPSLANLTVIGNAAAADGGGMLVRGIYGNSASPDLVNLTFSNNVAFDGGGMLNIYFTSATLTDVTLSGNAAVNDGGGMYNTEDSYPTLVRVVFQGNTACTGGGMVNTLWASPSLTDVVFDGNTASGSGGGMATTNSSHPALTDVIFSNNTAHRGGGSYYWYNADSFWMRGVRYDGNTADEGGGLYLAANATVWLFNGVFVGNQATAYGGAVYSKLSSLELTNVSFTGNSAVAIGGGIYSYDQTGLALSNLVMWGDSASVAPEIAYDSAPLATVDYSIIEGCGGSGAGWDPLIGVDAGGNLDADPLFVDAAGGDLHLLAGSPAVDAGNNDALAGDLLTDMDGNPRRVDIPSVPDSGNGSAPIVDIGPYESFPDVTIGKAVEPLANVPGGAITFTLTVTGSGSFTATDVVLTDEIAAYILATVVTTSNLSIIDTGASPAYVWEVQDVPPGHIGEITITGTLATPLAAGDYSNTAQIEFAGMTAAPNHSATVLYSVADLPPGFTSSPVTSAEVDVLYTYTVTTDELNGDAVAITAQTAPSWLTLTDHGNGTATLVGTPSTSDLGDHPVVLEASDGGSVVEQGFTVHVDVTPLFSDGFESGNTSNWS
jgi:uncharacterized repeat protein (TIGR01451 family)